MSDVSPRQNGHVPIASYGVIGDGRSIALVAPDGAIDWWCAPNLDSAPIYRRVVDASNRSIISVRPRGDFRARSNYIRNTNVLRIRFETDSGTMDVIYSLNSGSAGRLPWSELAVRLTVIKGSVDVRLDAALDNTEWNSNSRSQTSRTYKNGDRLLSILTSERLEKLVSKPLTKLTLKKGDSETLGIIVTDAEPQLIPDIMSVDHRIDLSIHEWKEWTKQVTFDGVYQNDVLRSALALKLLVYSPSGAIAAAGTTSLPERIGGNKNYDYRFAWIRDTAYTIKAFTRAGLTEEVQAALAWLLSTISRSGTDPPDVFYTLTGDTCGTMKELDYEGYRRTKPVRFGNEAAGQLQLGSFGDIMETIALFEAQGNQLDTATIALIERLMKSCETLWQRPDAGIWELSETRHYTISKVGCWLAFKRAIDLCTRGILPKVHLKRWQKLRDDIYDYIETACWNESIGAYTQSAGGNTVDASILLATRFDYPNKARLRSTLEVVETRLRRGPYVYRYEHAETEEGAFVACSYWLIEAYAFLGMKNRAKRYMTDVLTATRNELGLMSEMIDPIRKNFLGNIPQGLSHLAMIHAADALKVNHHGAQ